MDNGKQILDDKKYNRIIVILSILIPVVVAILFGVKIPNVAPLSFLPPIYATINGLTAVILVVALVAIKNKKMVLHENLMTTAIGCSVVFLVMYVAYHMTSDSTKFGGEGIIKYVYYYFAHPHPVVYNRYSFCVDHLCASHYQQYRKA